MDLLIEPPAAPSREELAALVRSLACWYQRIYLGRGIYSMDAGGLRALVRSLAWWCQRIYPARGVHSMATGGPPAHHEVVWARLKRAFPDDLRGASVLDVGCNAGYFSMHTKMRGAGRVLGIDSMEHFLKQAEFCKQI